jgi:probable rRNA maturation factor
MIEISDESGRGIDPEPYVRLAARVLSEMWLGENVGLEVTFVDEATMAELNREWMGEEGPTDVLSFPMDELRPGEEGSPTEDGVLGDVVVCPAVAAVQATKAGHSVEREMGLLLVHGILHLLGYDHATVVEEKEMFALQEELLDCFPDA